MISLRDVFEHRLVEFEDEFCWNDEKDCVLRGFLATGEWVALTLGETAAVDVMAAIGKALLNREASQTFEATDWREGWIVTEQLREWPSFFEDIHDLRAFAEAGIFRPARLADRDGLSSDEAERLSHNADVAAWVRQCAAVIDEFTSLAPEPTGHGAIYDALLKTQAKAQARLNFDEGIPLTAQELADLTGVSLKRVQNAAYEKGGRGPVMNKQGRIEREGAMDWLTRKGFKFSIWPQITALGSLTRDWGKAESVDPALLVNDSIEEAAEEFEADYVFVPVAADRTRFLPSTRRDQGYQVGAKGSETYFADYFEALQALSRQPTPRWRRPNEAGNWGIVSGVAWERVARTDLARDLVTA